MNVSLWIVVLSYWLHLLATVIWLGGQFLMFFVAWPALRKKTLVDNLWFTLQRRFTPWASGSLVVLLITGLVQMTGDPNYHGFLVLDSLWAWAILAKHAAFAGMTIIAAYFQWVLHPAMSRLRILLENRPDAADAEHQDLTRRENRLLRANLFCSAVVLLFTAIATAL